MIRIVTSSNRHIDITTNVGRRFNINNLICDPVPTKSDNHVDTHVFGASFKPISWSSLSCSVSPFIGILSSHVEIELFVAGKVWKHPSGETCIRIPGQGLWFDERMKNISLFKSNQCRSFSIIFYDNPADLHRELGI